MANKEVAYKVVNFAGKAEVMSAQALCEDAQDKPKVVGRRISEKAVGATTSPGVRTENEIWAAAIKAERMRLKRARMRAAARENSDMTDKSNTQARGEAEQLHGLSGNGPESNPTSVTATSAVSSTSEYRGGVFNSMD